MDDEFLLTTVDNPYNPFTHYDEWREYDISKGYNTESFLARVILTSDELSDVDYDLAYADAVNEILEHDVLGIYMKIKENNKIKAIVV